MLARQWLPSLSVLQNAEPHGAHPKMEIFLHNAAQHRCVRQMDIHGIQLCSTVILHLPVSFHHWREIDFCLRKAWSVLVASLKYFDQSV